MTSRLDVSNIATARFSMGALGATLGVSMDMPVFPGSLEIPTERRHEHPTTREVKMATNSGLLLRFFECINVIRLVSSNA
jgi:hypothetical protein